MYYVGVMTKKPAKKKPSITPGKTAVMLRLSSVELERLDAVAHSLTDRMPFASRGGVAHAAMLLGLSEIERDASVLLPK